MVKREKAVNTITLKKSQKYLSDSGLKSLPAGRIDKRYTGIGATTFEIKDLSRNSIVVCPTVALASSKAAWALEELKDKSNVTILFLGSEVSVVKSSEEKDIISALEDGNIVKVLAVVDTFVKYFNGLLKDYRDKFHLVIDEADSLQLDSRFRPVMEDCLDLYCEFPPQNRTMISATWYESVLKKLRHEPLTRIQKVGEELKDIRVRKVKGYLPYLVGRNIKEQIAKNTGTKILVAANSFDLIQEIITCGNIQVSDISILCGEASVDQAAYLKGNIVNGHLPEKKVIFITSAYFIGIDILDKVIIYIVADVRYDSSLVTPQQVYQICGRARGKNLSRYFYLNQLKSDPKTKDLKGLQEEAEKQLKNLDGLSSGYRDFKIASYSEKKGGCFYRVKEKRLVINYLLFDFRLNRYKVKTEVYGKGSNPKEAFKEYFKVIFEEFETLPMGSTKVKKVQKKIQQYKADLIRAYAISPYGWYNTPFVDPEVKLAKSLIYGLPEAARERYGRFIHENAEFCDNKILNELSDRIAKYSFSAEIGPESLKKLLQEFDEMDALIRKT